jgi:hypothetical protein
MDFFIEKFMFCFGVRKITPVMNNKYEENISLENLNLGQSDPSIIPEIPETTEIPETPEIPENTEIPETPEIPENTEITEIINKFSENEFYYEEDYSSLVLTNSETYENFSTIICGFFYTVSFIIMINLFFIQRQFLIKNYFK